MGGLDDGYFVVDSGHEGLGIDREAIQAAKEAEKARAIAAAKEAAIAKIKQRQAGAGSIIGGAGTNWMLWGGVAAAAVLGLVVLKRRKKA